MNVETVRAILERTFQMPVSESDAQIVLDRFNEIQFREMGQQTRTGGVYCPKGHLLYSDGMCGRCERYYPL